MQATERTITFQRPDGQSAPAFVFPAARGLEAPGLVLLQEAWGVTDQLRGVARRLNAAGIAVMIPDLYRGRVPVDAEDAMRIGRTLDIADAITQDVIGALTLARAHHAKVAAMGFCMGGGMAAAAAVNMPELAAAVCFYGMPPASLADPTRLRVPLQAHFAEHDRWCPPAAVDALEEQLRRSSAELEFYRYDAHHGFFNETRPEAYDPAAAALAWDRTLAFLGRHLGVGLPAPDGT